MGAARQILQRGRSIPKHGTVHAVTTLERSTVIQVKRSQCMDVILKLQEGSVYRVGYRGYMVYYCTVFVCYNAAVDCKRKLAQRQIKHLIWVQCIARNVGLVHAHCSLCSVSEWEVAQLLLYLSILYTHIRVITTVVYSFSNDIVLVYKVAQKRGHNLTANILKFRDRIAWKLVNFCNIIYWTQSLTFCLKISSRCGAT